MTDRADPNGLRSTPDGYEAAMASDAPNEQTDVVAAPGASVATPSGTNAVAVYSDLRCPWARVAVERLLAAVERSGVETELSIDHRWFPLGDEAMPSDGEALDRTLGPIGSLDPDAEWHRWAGSDASFPESSNLAAAWVQAAKLISPAASVALDRALRDALFAHGRDIADESVVADVAAGLDGVDVDAVRSEVGSGRPEVELERHAEIVHSELVPASPTIVLGDGTAWTNPGVEFHTEDGAPVIDSDGPGVYGEIVQAFLAQRHYD